MTARLASPVALRQAIDRHSRRGRHGVPAFRAALEEWVIDGKPVDSVLEPAMRRLFERYRLPPYEFHARIARSRGRLPHRRHADRARVRRLGVPRQDPAQQDADAARDAHLAEHGYISVRFTYHQIVREPAKQARRIRAIIDRWAPELGAQVLEIENLRAQTAD